MALHSIVGEWRGHYQYPRFPELSSAFTAFFLEKNGRLDASIIDDCWPGKATGTGTFSYPKISFVKIYVNQSKTMMEGQFGKSKVQIEASTAPVHYHGAMSEDGKSMSGTWTISEPSYATGTWTAYRADAEENAEEEEAGKRIKQPQFDEQLL